MKNSLPKRKMIRYCLSDIAKGLFNGMIGNYLLGCLSHPIRTTLQKTNTPTISGLNWKMQEQYL